MKTTTSRALVSFSIISLAGCAAHGEAGPRNAARDHAQEEAACAGIPSAQRLAGPFGGSSTIARVEPLVEQVQIGKQTYPRKTGVKVTVMAEPGMTRPWLARVAECHAAIHQAEGPGVDEGRPCPFSDGSVTISVVEAPTSFVVSLRSQAEDDAKRVLGLAEDMKKNAVDSRSANAGTRTQ
jgi:hypothetical protein